MLRTEEEARKPCPHCDDGRVEISDMGRVRCRFCNPDPNNDSDWPPEEDAANAEGLTRSEHDAAQERATERFLKRALGLPEPKDELFAISVQHNIDCKELAAAMAGMEPEAATRFGRLLGSAIDWEAGDGVFLAFVAGLCSARDDLYGALSEQRA